MSIQVNTDKLKVVKSPYSMCSPFFTERVRIANQSDPKPYIDFARDKEIIKINGKPLMDFVTDEDYVVNADGEKQLFGNNNDKIKFFFKRVILADMVDEDKKESSAKYLVKTLHQGGFLHPLNSAITDAFGEKAAGAVSQNNPQFNRVNILTNKNGFIVQEKIIQTELRTSLEEYEVNNYTIGLKDNEPFHYKAIGTLQVDFNKKAGRAHLKVINCSIECGTEIAKKYLDDRNIFQRFIDKIKSVLGTNTVEEIKEVKEKVNGDVVEGDNKAHRGLRK